MPRDSELDRLVADLSGLPRNVRRQAQPALERAARPIERDMKQRASWSSRIPGAIRITTSRAGLFGAKRAPGVRLIVDASKAPHARAFEGIASGRATFRHPVYAVAGRQRVWVAQKARPFFAPAIVAGQAGVIRAVDEAIQAAARGTVLR